MRKLTFFFILIFLSSMLFADWRTTVNGGFSGFPFSIDIGHDAIETTDGYFVIGRTDMLLGTGLFMLKTDLFGNLLWTRAIGYGEGSSALATRNGFAIVGTTTSDTISIWFILTDDYGETLRTSHFGGRNEEFGNRVINSHEGGYAILGTVDFNSAFSTADIGLFVTDSLGELLWQRKYSSGIMEFGQCIIRTLEGGYAIAGGIMENSSGLGLCAYVLEIGPSGDTVWTRKFPDITRDFAYSIVQNEDSTFVFASGNKIVKLDGSGDVLWDRVICDTMNIGVYSMKSCHAGGFILAGYSYPSTGFPLISDAAVLRSDENGLISWFQTFGGSGQDFFHSITQTGDLGFIATGAYTNPFPESTDVFLVKIGPEYIGDSHPSSPVKISMGIFPNPFNSSVSIKINRLVATPSSRIQVEIFDIKGRRVQGFEGSRVQGKTEIIWQPEEDLPSGVYLVRARFDPSTSSGHSGLTDRGNSEMTKRIVYLK